MAALDWLVIAGGCGAITGIVWYFFLAERARSPQPSGVRGQPSEAP